MQLSFSANDDFLKENLNLPMATEAQIDLARVSALRKTGKWLTTQIKKSVAGELRIPQKALTDRMKIGKIGAGDDELRVWIGTWNISPESIGTPSVYGVPGKTGGVRAGRLRFRGAFMAKIYGFESVWIRLYSKHYDPKLYPGKGDDSSGRYTGTDPRFPVVRAGVAIDDVVARALDTLENSVGVQFEKIFTRELNFQVNVKGATA